ncbi:spore protease YyaC [Sporolactobacillus sp. THM7-4]|nr:spore protease YyaC [Sporolactobacillus sp. THM7-4]
MNLKWDRSTVKKSPEPVHYEDKDAHHTIVHAIQQYLPARGDTPLIVVCIGTDRSTGDALGPLVGRNLEKLSIPDTHVFGTLEKPVHAVNLEETLGMIRDSFRHPFVIGIDACLGRQKNVGMICVSKGPVLPGAGVNKRLIPVGDMNITGIVNVSGFMEYAVLQNTRLNIVMNLSEVISRCLHQAILSREQYGFQAKLRIGQKF